MARKEKTITLQDGEQELTFRIKQMPATRLHRWKAKGIMLLAAGGIQIPTGFDLKKAAGFLMQQGLTCLGSLDYDSQIHPLITELLECCSRQVGNAYELCTWETLDNYIQDDITINKLYLESAQLNLNFTLPGPETSSGSQENSATETQ